MPGMRTSGRLSKSAPNNKWFGRAFRNVWKSCSAPVGKNAASSEHACKLWTSIKLSCYTVVWYCKAPAKLILTPQTNNFVQPLRPQWL